MKRMSLLGSSSLCVVCVLCLLPTIPAWVPVWNGALSSKTFHLPRQLAAVSTSRPASLFQSQRAAVKSMRDSSSNPVFLRMDSSRMTDAEVTLLDDLLCQRAIQNQLYYFEEFRDGFKKQWLECFYEHEGIYSFHGFGGLQVPAGDYLSAMMSSPPHVHEVRASWGNRYTGGSKDNPYLRQQRYHTYNETVHPQKICKGIMEIREQIAKEWIEDVEFFKMEDDIFWHDFEVMSEQELSAPKNNLDPGEEAAHMEERQTLFGVGISGDFQSTPLRKRSFDVLKKASTWVAVQKTLLSFRAERDGAEDWFRALWEGGWRQQLEASGPSGVADNFLRSLVEMPSRAAGGKEEGTLRMIVPADIARRVLEQRQEVLEGWKRWLESGEHRDRHTEIQRALLLRSLNDEFTGSDRSSET